jgi:hypothetical protein
VTDYRLYCLSGSSKIENAEWLEAKSDDEAIVLVRAMKKSIDCELWHGNRLVSRIPASEAAA